jgi:tetratricopeptide (TPR) repeat protein
LVYSEILNIYPKRAETSNHLGVSHIAEGKIDDALKIIQMAIQSNPNFALAHFNRAVFLFQLGKREEAFQEFKLAARLEPNNSKFQYQLGLFYLKVRKEKDQAIFYLKKSIRLDPDRNIKLEVINLLNKNS